MFYIAGGLTVLNLFLLFLFDDSEMISKKTKEHIAKGEVIALK
jgi:hypothetical protein